MHQLPSENIDVLKYQESLKQWLRQYPQFTDYDFEGTNFSVLLSVLAYNAYTMAHYGSMVGNEAWIDTAQLRQSQVSHATDLNYLPRSMVSAHAELEVEIFPTDTPASIVLPKYYRFRTSGSNGETLYFVTDQDYIATRDEEGRYVFPAVNVFQGEISQEYFLVDGIEEVNGRTIYNQQFIISSEAIDINSLEVFVKANENSNVEERYTYAKTLAETTADSRTFFLRGIYDNQYAIEFGDGVFGNALTNGNQIIARFRNTLGAIVQGNYVLSKTTDIQGYSDIVINKSTRVQGGFDRESVEELRINAPRYFQTQDRAVTHVDYETIIKTNFPNIQQVNVYGGEEVEQYGKVFIVIKPRGILGVISDTIKTQIVDLLKTKNIVPEPIITDPDYYYIGVDGTVFYKADLTKLTEAQIRSSIITNLVALNDDPINGIGDFDKHIYQSMLTNTIMKSNSAIQGADVTIAIHKRWMPAVNLNETLTMELSNPLYVSRDGAHRNANDYTLSTNTFQAFLGEELRTVALQDDGAGKIFYYLVQPDGSKIKFGQSIGTINYETGSVKLVANVYDYLNYIDVTVRLRNKSFKTKLQSFALIDGKDISLNFERL